MSLSLSLSLSSLILLTSLLFSVLLRFVAASLSTQLSKRVAGGVAPDRVKKSRDSFARWLARTRARARACVSYSPLNNVASALSDRALLGRYVCACVMWRCDLCRKCEKRREGVGVVEKKQQQRRRQYSSSSRKRRRRRSSRKRSGIRVHEPTFSLSLGYIGSGEKRQHFALWLSRSHR